MTLAASWGNQCQPVSSRPPPLGHGASDLKVGNGYRLLCCRPHPSGYVFLPPPPPPAAPEGTGRPCCCPAAGGHKAPQNPAPFCPDAAVSCFPGPWHRVRLSPPPGLTIASGRGSALPRCLFPQPRSSCPGLGSAGGAGSGGLTLSLPRGISHAASSPSSLATP